MNILIADEMHPSLFEMLEQHNWQYSYQPAITRSEIIEQLSSYEGLIIRSKTPLDKPVLEKAPKLIFIGRAGAGLEQIDLDEVNKRNIQLFAAPEGNRDAVGEHTLAMLLCLLNKVHIADNEVRQKIWKREANRGIEIKGKTIGIIGYGNMGKAFAKRLRGFECEVLTYDKYLQNYGDEFAKESTLEVIFDKTDILSLHIPLTTASRFMINSEFINSFRKNFYLINTARGEIVKLSDLQQAIENGKISGACLDVLENEKLHTLTPEQEILFDWLFTSEKIIFTPHIAGWTQESYIRINEVLVEKIEKFLAKS
jgi:D-3-phosphoglycerate dehydrogenase